ncbi:hypothetical protein [Sphingosinicella xenopeptidilytica]|uniref:Uncharacterized protein n=1 Tax=Sphingosinicella xenopeptidilytica TaxID=364098 RepID=A0ABW3C4K0_SPHXN
MTIRTTVASVIFRSPFLLKPMKEMQPEGTYDIETDEEIIEGNTHTVYRRIATVILLRSTGVIRRVTIDPDDLRAALDNDGRGYAGQS